MQLLYVSPTSFEVDLANLPGGQSEEQDQFEDEPNNENPATHFLQELDENGSQEEQFDTLHVTRNNNWLEYVYG